METLQKMFIDACFLPGPRGTAIDFWEQLGRPDLRDALFPEPGNQGGHLCTPLDAMFLYHSDGSPAEDLGQEDSALIAFLQQRGSRISSLGLDSINNILDLVAYCDQGLDLSGFDLTEVCTQCSMGNAPFSQTANCVLVRLHARLGQGAC